VPSEVVEAGDGKSETIVDNIKKKYDAEDANFHFNIMD